MDALSPDKEAREIDKTITEHYQSMTFIRQ
jgi:hypothetical protein